MIGLGKAAGALSSVMATLDIPLEPVYPPYYRIQDAYPLCSPERLLQLCTSPPEQLAACANELKQLREALPDLFEALRGMEYLPHQLVHGDVNASNVLVDQQDGEICAILDFEFATWDLRVMELAVPMSDFLTMDKSEDWMWQAQEGLIRGFREQVSLEPEELLAIPRLILLRSLDVVMHFISRMFEGTDEPEVAVEQIVKLKQRGSTGCVFMKNDCVRYWCINIVIKDKVHWYCSYEGRVSALLLVRKVIYEDYSV